ncbi:hypothetical protein ATY75_12130 [Rhizobium sp. N122]|nr:hypothetical protein ATY75_12130 [Rhizobium sp. N122]
MNQFAYVAMGVHHLIVNPEHAIVFGCPPTKRPCQAVGARVMQGNFVNPRQEFAVRCTGTASEGIAMPAQALVVRVAVTFCFAGIAAVRNRT